MAVMRLPHISNFDDFDPLHLDQDVRLRYVERVGDFGSPDLVIIPGSKTTVVDLRWLRRWGLAERIITARRAGIPVVGICAGYQMLGEWLFDPHGVESTEAEIRGLGLLSASTTFATEKATHQVELRVQDKEGLLAGCHRAQATAYEIHMGVTSSHEKMSPFMTTTRSNRAVRIPEGTVDIERLTLGTNFHGLFHNRAVRRSILACAAGRADLTWGESRQADLDQDTEFEKLADWVSRHLDMDVILGLVGVTP